MDFFNALDLDSKLRKSIQPYLEELESRSLWSLLLTTQFSDAYKCPICFKAITTKGRFISHFKWMRNRWEFQRLINIVERLPNSFHYYQNDYLGGEHSTKLYRRVRLWIVAKKILAEINPRSVEALDGWN